MLNRILGVHPIIEYLVRAVAFRSNYLMKFNSIRFQKNSGLSFNFDDIFPNLIHYGVTKKDILIVHSSYENISSCGLSPRLILDKLIDFICEGGTLAMNSSRRLKSDGNGVYTYDTMNSRVISGVLPAVFLKHPGVSISRFPINPMVALGRQAKNMMEGNLCQDYLSSCGDLSSWKFCADNDAWVLGMGIDLIHSLTIVHVNEESNHSMWPVRNWFEEKKVEVIDNGKVSSHIVLDRKMIFGKLHFAERTLAKDLVANGILKVFYLNDVRFELVNSRSLLEFLRQRKTKAYPYFFIPKKFFRKW